MCLSFVILGRKFNTFVQRVEEMVKTFSFVVALASLGFVGLMVFGQEEVDPPCYQIAQSTTKSCANQKEKKNPVTDGNNPVAITFCNNATYKSKPLRFPSSQYRASSGTIHEGPEDCWYSQPCLWQVVVNTSACLPNTLYPENWSTALKMQDDSETTTCNDLDFEQLPAL